MTLEIVNVLLILVVSVIFLIFEWVPMEVTALMTLGILALTGLLSPFEALSGFSSPAVITIWAVFILSGGLTRTGVANVIGRYVMRVGGKSETHLTISIMVSAGVMSAFMNNVAVAALMLPVIMDISCRTEWAPSRLLMPLAYGSLLGGLTTLIGTPPNILVSDALRENSLEPFGLFDYTSVGIFVMITGIGFMIFAGKYLLPGGHMKKVSCKSGRYDFKKLYDLEKGMFQLRIPHGSKLAGKTISQVRMRSLLGLHLLSIQREKQNILAPLPAERLEDGDILVVEGERKDVEYIDHWCRLIRHKQMASVEDIFALTMDAVEARPADGPTLIGKTLNEIGFRSRFGINVLATKNDSLIRRWGFQDDILTSGTTLLLYGPKDRLKSLRKKIKFDDFESVSAETLNDTYRLYERLMKMNVSGDPEISGKTLAESRLGDALGMNVLSIERNGKTHYMPEPEFKLYANDRLLVLGNPEIVEVFEGLDALTHTVPMAAISAKIESDEVGLTEAMLSPHTTLVGKTLRQLRFRDKYDLTVLAVWREGRALLYSLRDLPLRFGDALLLHGRREKFSLLGQDPDFLVLSEAAQDEPRRHRMSASLCIFGGVLITVVAGLLPIYIAAVIGSALMVAFRCLSMEEAYRFIEWKAVFLIAGMLPLGLALDKTGAARFLANGVVTVAGPFGPMAVMGSLVGLTFLATCFVPTAALVVLMAPIALKTSADMGIAPHTLMMAVAMAASSSFITPVSHPANVLVMGPAGYRFVDYVKVGLPLTLVVFVVIMLVVPLFWAF